jgi:hypothetical protein
MSSFIAFPNEGVGEGVAGVEDDSYRGERTSTTMPVSVNGAAPVLSMSGSRPHCSEGVLAFMSPPLQPQPVVRGCVKTPYRIGNE